VLEQQGRVALDADANEQRAIDDYLRATETVDVIGTVGGPAHDEGFKITLGDHDDIEIGKGRYYVNGLLCENEHQVGYMDQQPFLIGPDPTDTAALDKLKAGTINVIQVYLEVWQRLVTALDDPCLREPALGHADTTARLQTVWRVVLETLLQTEPSSGNCCQAMDAGPIPAPDPGKLHATTGSNSDCGCQPIPAAGYLGLENQLYRVEIHHAGTEKDATFKWSRENGSVVAAITAVSGNKVTIDSLGLDANLGFSTGQWVEIYDDSNLFGPTPNQPGTLYQIQECPAGTLTVTMTQPVGGVDPVRNARMRRWDQSGTSADGDGVNVAAGPLPLENGIEIEFSTGQYRSGDYWLIPARTATGSIEWPPCGSDDPSQPPRRTEIFRAPLACIQLNSQGRVEVQDCRKKFYPLTDLTPCTSTATCCTYHVGDGCTSFGDFTKIQDAIDKLPPEGGEICILPGRYYENVSIIGCRDIVIHGCGWQTRVASPSPSGNNPDATVVVKTPVNALAAVFTIVASHHIELRSFAVEAADDAAGILIDGTGTTLSREQIDKLDSLREPPRGVSDVTIADMVIAAATLPAILAEQVAFLRIDRNRIAMKNVRGLWNALYVSGEEIHIEHNHLGIQSALTDSQWLPYTVTDDLKDTTSKSAAAAATSTAASVALHQGGIQIGGRSTDVYIIENEIDGGRGNGITLGSLEVLDANQRNTGILAGSVALTLDDGDCENTATLQSSGAWPEGNGYTVVAGGILTNVQIHRNRIWNMGLCGIGPVAFFDFRIVREIISVVGMNISGNAITSTLLSGLKPDDFASRSLGYGAICVPDVSNLIVRDNTITDFGDGPEAPVCGIFVLHGEMIEISRNQVVESRDWANYVGDDQKDPVGVIRGGIFILTATPPAYSPPTVSPLGQSVIPTSFSEPGAAPAFDPGLPAVRVEHNVVRVPQNYALAVNGVGPFTVTNNHLGCGGLVRSTAPQLAQTVLILNWGTAIESPTATRGVSETYDKALGQAGVSAVGDSYTTAGGAVLFTNNICQLWATVSGQTEAASVFIFTPDHLIFSHNHCWLNTASGGVSALADALLLAGSLNVVGNRFQEAPLSVYLSAFTAGVVNVTSQNISTFCIVVLGLLRAKDHNLALLQLEDPEGCTDRERGFTERAQRETN
jgi:hypothetical protein